MPTIKIETSIAASPQVCFDLSRNIDIHRASIAHSGERAVEGVTTGLIGAGGSVTWEAAHLGIRWRLKVTITEFDPPHRFVDEQTSGPFRSLRHVHEFVTTEQGTLMIDRFAFSSPFGPIGALVDRVVLTRYLRGVLRKRGDFLKRTAEGSIEFRN